jgi:membrane fusion protein, multidrug efflux system
MNQFFRYSGLLLLMVSTASFATDADGEASQEPKGVPVTVVQAKVTTVILATTVRGNIESLNTPQIAAKVSAEVMTVDVDEGVAVESGQLLASLDDEAFRLSEEAAKADIKRLQVTVKHNKRTLKRDKDLIEKKLVSESKLDDADTALQQSQAELISAKTRLKEAQYLLSHTRILSPVTGVIQIRSISKGDYVNSGDPLFQIVTTDKLRARLFFPETLADVIEPGMDVELTHDNETVTGKVSRLRPRLEEGNRALHVLVDFDNEHNWKPGSSISARVILEEHANAIVVPERALVRRPSGLVLYRVEDNSVSENVVTTGLTQNALTEVVSGIDAGDTIVLDGAAWLTDGTSVEIQETVK